MSDLTEYSARLKGATNVAFLGSLCWYSAAETVCVPHAEMEQHLKDVGLDAFTPKAPRDDDVFRRVCSKAQRKRVPTANARVFENYLVRDVQRKGLKVTKQIVQEQVDADNKRLGYRPMIQIEFDTTAGSIDTDYLDVSGNIQPGVKGMNPEFARAEEIADQIITTFQSNRATMNGYAVRELIRRILVSSNATMARAAVYFVGRDQADRVEALEQLAAKITDASFHSLPLVDDQKQRTMVREAFRSETADELRRRLVEIDDLNKLPADELAKQLKKITNLRDEVKPLRAKLTTYTELLEDSLSEVELELKSYDRKIVGLIMKSMGGDIDDDE